MLWLSGTPRVMVGDLPAPRLPDKVYALMCLLALRFNNVADRGALADLLWEDGDEASARANLRNLLSRLRTWQNLNSIRLLDFDASRVFRGADCEPSDLDALLKAGLAQDELAVAALFSLRGGELLSGCGKDFAPELAAWINEQRTALDDRFLDLVLPAARVGGQAMLGLLRRLMTALPLDERVERALLVSLSRHHSREAIDSEYQRFARRLLADAGTAPDPETRELARQLGARSDSKPAGVAALVQPRLQNSALPRVLILPPIDDEFSKRSASRAAASLVDDVTYGLCQQRSFAVIAPHSARAMSRNGTLRIGQNMDYVLSTRLLPGQIEGEYRFGFSLARDSTGEILIGDALRFTLQDLPARHADLSRLVVRLVAGEIERHELASYRFSGTPTAYVYYLLGQERLRMVDLPDLRAARNAFRRALDLAPAFAPAMSMIARTLSLEWFILNRGDDDLLKESRRMAALAVEHDPLDPSGHRELGNAALYSHDLDASLEHLREARERAPHHADVLLDNADALAHNSRYQEAQVVIAEALSLNPIAPDEYLWVASTIQFFLHDYAGALNLALRMANPEPLGRLIATSAHLIGDKHTARHWRNRMLERHPDFRVADWGRIVPIRNATDKQFFEDAMRSAGFP